MRKFVQIQHNNRGGFQGNTFAAPTRGNRQIVSQAINIASRQPLGNQAMQHLLHSRVIQAKFKISQPGDKYEQEADRVAEQVMRMPEPQVAEEATIPGQTQGIQIQRVCAECDEELHRQPIEEEEELLQAKEMSGQTSEFNSSIEANINAVRGGGTLLPESVRSYFEPRFGYDFRQVRVHTDTRAVESTRAVNARAFTFGRNIVFGASEYSPETARGKRLVAHELTHVVQQARGIVPDRRISHSQEHIQRLVRRSRVTCPAPGGGIRNPYSADRRASKLLEKAISRINSAMSNRLTNPADADVVAVGNALRRAFRLNPARNSTWTLGPPRVRLPIILRRLEIVKNYIDSVVFRFNCFANGVLSSIPPCASNTCTPTNEAQSCPSNSTDMILCPLFWTRNRNQQGRIIAHEVFHITFGFINDWGQPDVHNAHCYAQFIALLNGFNSPTGFRCH